MIANLYKKVFQSFFGKAREVAIMKFQCKGKKLIKCQVGFELLTSILALCCMTISKCTIVDGEKSNLIKIQILKHTDQKDQNLSAPCAYVDICILFRFEEEGFNPPLLSSEVELAAQFYLFSIISLNIRP